MNLSEVNKPEIKKIVVVYAGLTKPVDENDELNTDAIIIGTSK